MQGRTYSLVDIARTLNPGAKIDASRGRRYLYGLWYKGLGGTRDVNGVNERLLLKRICQELELDDIGGDENEGYYLRAIAQHVGYLGVDLHRTNLLDHIAKNADSLPWNPTKLGNLDLWYDPDISFAQVLGFYQTLADLTGNGYHLSQSNAANRPLLPSESTDGNLFYLGWPTSKGSLVETGESDPDGGTDAGLFTEDNTSGQHSMQRTVSVPANKPLNVKVKLKPNGRNYVKIRNVTNGVEAVYDIQNGLVVSSSGSVDASISDVGDGFYLCEWSYTPGTDGGLAIYFRSMSDSTTDSYLGDGSSGFYYYQPHAYWNDWGSGFVDLALFSKFPNQNGKRVAVFDGSDVFMDNADGYAVNGVDGFTIFGNGNFIQNATQNWILASRTVSPGSLTCGIRTLQTTGNLELFTRDADDSTTRYYNSGTPFNYGKMTFFAATWTPSRVALFVNGTMVKEFSGSYDIQAIPQEVSMSITGSNSAQGTQGGCGIYGRPLEDSEVIDYLYNYYKERYNIQP